MKQLATVLAAGLSVLASCGAEERAPDVFFIVCDTLRADHLGCYGYERDVSPRIDELAAASTRFEMALTSAPATMPAMWNMMLSQYQAEVPSPPEEFTLAEFFKSRGYRTGAFVAQRFLGAGMSNLDQGFDRYDDEQTLDQYMTSKRRATSVTDSAIAWLEEGTDEPTFAWLVYFDPHDPYVPPEGHRGTYNAPDAPFSGDRRGDGLMKDSGVEVTPEHKQFLINAYDEEIRYMDLEFGRFLDHLRETDRFDDAIVIFTSDHGEELGDNGGRWDHSQLLSQEELHVPLLFKLPGEQAVSSVRQPVQNIDLYPTLVDYLDPESSVLAGLSGQSLLPLLEGEEQPNRVAYAFWESQLARYDVRHKYWLIAESRERGRQTVTEVHTGRGVQDPELVQELYEETTLFWQMNEFEAQYFGDNVQRLKDLGYF